MGEIAIVFVGVITVITAGVIATIKVTGSWERIDEEVKKAEAFADDDAVVSVSVTKERDYNREKFE